MTFVLDDLVGCLALDEVAPGVVEGANLDIGYHRVFGGQILAQVLTAAAMASPEKSVKSLHALFPREGDTAVPMRYRVEVLQDGRTFGTIPRSVTTASSGGPTAGAGSLRWRPGSSACSDTTAAAITLAP